jgi:dolichol-phosphate mannosyltransferase
MTKLKRSKRRPERQLNRHFSGVKTSISRIRAKLPLDRFLRFGVVGFSGLFVDYTIFFLLFTQVGLGLTLSNVLSAETAIINNFFWNDAWTFADLSRQQAGWQARFRRFSKFNLVCLVGLIINTLLVNLFFNIFSINAYLAKFFAIAVVTLWNFWVNFKLSWKTSNPSDSKDV